VPVSGNEIATLFSMLITGQVAYGRPGARWPAWRRRHQNLPLPAASSQRLMAQRRL
jgi:hypothetical protein